MPARYLPNETYSAMIDALAAAHEAHDPRTRIIELVGEYANVWPEDVLEDGDTETSIDELIAETLFHLASFEATDRHSVHAERLAILLKLVSDTCNACGLSSESSETIRRCFTDHYAGRLLMQTVTLNLDRLSPATVAMLQSASAKYETAD
ncbi:hypothetical protein PVW46_11030 [Mameliella sp. AT18]|uniref:hypothetical protein n=1 Tax=Mameliella sp. AT18 TaxID=3028385 RepID=UPI00237C3E15|nr:hypothetical protein [Mameliella sp. AT18]MDD9730442.1 hypothetical protein [Mameliella sp. AT18]